MKSTIQDMKDLVEGINERICELGDKRRIVIRRTSDKWLVQAVCPNKFRFDLLKANQRTMLVWLRAYYRGLLMPRTS
jgi:hypothetical protein